MGRLLLRGDTDQRDRTQSLGAYSGGREAGRYGQGHRDRHSEDAYRGGSGPQAGPHRLRHREDHRRERIPSGKRGSDRHPRSGQHRRTREPDQASEGVARQPRRSRREEGAGRDHRVREDQAGQPAGAGRRGRQGPRFAGRDLRCLRSRRRPLQSSYPFHLRCIQFRSEKRQTVRARQGVVRRVRQERGPVRTATTAVPR